MDKLLIVDDHPIFRNGLRQALADMGQFCGIVEAGSGSEALSALAKERFDIAVVDVGLPDLSGFDILEVKAREVGAPRFFVLTMNADAALARKAFRLGASGFASKSISLPVLALALRLVSAGELYAESEILRDILTSETHGGQVPAHRRLVDSLTERERAMLDAIVAGLNVKEAADRLGVSTRTAENYQSAVYAKLGVKTPVGLVKVAYGAGLPVLH